MTPSNNTDYSRRGHLVPIGGAEEKFHNPEILDKFVDICGGKSARIAIIPTASELENTGRNYEKLFRKLGIQHAQVLQLITREDCQSDKYLEYIEKADGVFMTGGNQLRLSTTLGGTPVAQCGRYARRRHIGRCRVHAGTYDRRGTGGQHAAS
jgi:cyanophycinase